MAAHVGVSVPNTSNCQASIKGLLAISCVSPLNVTRSPMSNLPKDSNFNEGWETKEKEGRRVSVFSNYLSCTVWNLVTVY